MQGLAEEREREHRAECEALRMQLAAFSSGDSNAQAQIGELAEELKKSREAAAAALEDAEKRLQEKCNEHSELLQACTAAEAKLSSLHSERAASQSASHEVLLRGSELDVSQCDLHEVLL
jgi:chromosome segregation ATPase